MRYWPIVILVALCGCASHQLKPPSSAVPIQERCAVVAGEIELTIGDGRETVAPPGSATAGSKWIEHAVIYTNRSERPIWIVGYSETDPFSRIETRANEDGGWCDYGLGYCGTGAREFEIAPNASHTFKAALPKKYAGQEFRVMLPYHRERGSVQWVQAASQARRVNGPAAG